MYEFSGTKAAHNNLVNAVGQHYARQRQDRMLQEQRAYNEALMQKQWDRQDAVRADQQKHALDITGLNKGVSPDYHGGDANKLFEGLSMLENNKEEKERRLKLEELAEDDFKRNFEMLQENGKILDIDQQYEMWDGFRKKRGLIPLPKNLPEEAKKKAIDTNLNDMVGEGTVLTKKYSDEVNDFKNKVLMGDPSGLDAYNNMIKNISKNQNGGGGISWDDMPAETKNSIYGAPGSYERYRKLETDAEKSAFASAARDLETSSQFFERAPDELRRDKIELTNVQDTLDKLEQSIEIVSAKGKSGLVQSIISGGKQWLGVAQGDEVLERALVDINNQLMKIYEVSGMKFSQKEITDMMKSEMVSQLNPEQRNKAIVDKLRSRAKNNLAVTEELMKGYASDPQAKIRMRNEYFERSYNANLSILNPQSEYGVKTEAKPNKLSREQIEKDAKAAGMTPNEYMRMLSKKRKT